MPPTKIIFIKNSFAKGTKTDQKAKLAPKPQAYLNTNKGTLLKTSFFQKIQVPTKNAVHSQQHICSLIVDYC